MKLSILIPMYNASAYIGNCLDSLLMQNLPQDDYEIIVMDDGSNDNSVAIVKGYQKINKNILLHQEPNSGAYSTRNKLLKLATGTYVYNLDADDYIVHNCLCDLLQFSEDKSIDIIGFKTKETKVLNLKEIEEPINNKDFEISSGPSFIEKHRKLRHEIWWYFIRRDFLLNNHMAFSKNEYNADVVFTLKALLRANKIAYLPISIHRYVQTQNSLMRSKDFEIISNRLKYMQMMIINKSKLINEVNKSEKFDAIVLIDNLTHRRDVFVFFNILNMIRNPFHHSHIKKKIEAYKQVEAYPIKNFIGKEYHSFLYRFLLYVVNKEELLFPIIKLKNLFFKTNRSSNKTVIV